jgi:phosphonate C-P lyase system protein PhnG
MSNSVPNKYWAIALSKIDESKLQSFVEENKYALKLTVITSEPSGIALLEMEESVLRERFYLGEVAVGECCMEVKHLETGEVVNGYCHLLGRSGKVLEYIAICDALLRMEGFLSEELNILLESGYLNWQQEMRLRELMMEQTKVDFSIL